MRVLFALFLVCGLAAALTCQDETELVAKCDALFANPPRSLQTAPGDAVGAAARWAFHDAGTWDPSTRTGGAQACLAVTSCTGCEQDAADNRGLRPYTDEILRIRAGTMANGRSVASVIGIADLFYLCSTRAIERAANPAFVTPVTKVYGRQDCSLARPSFPGRLPSADPRTSRGQSNVFQQYVDIFERRLGFTTREVCGLLGTHSLGRAEFVNSGFNGSWVLGREAVFSSNFYDLLHNSAWHRRTIDSTHQQWNIPTGSIADPRKSFALVTDIGLIWNVDNSRTCNITVNTATRCPLETRTGLTGQNTERIIQDYLGGTTTARNNFHRDWKAAWDKLIRFGQSNLAVCTQCGNGVCNAGESSSNCPADCGTSTTPPPSGNGRATAPTNVRGTRVTTNGMMISWTPGTANGCVFSSWRVTSTALDFPPPGCNSLTQRSVPNCNATGILSGATLQWLVEEICTDTSLNSNKSAPSPAVTVLTPGCGNGFCESTETLASCPADCPVCGNGVCSSNEDVWCPQDCSTAVCGNGVCDASETVASCPADCKCGNGVCDSGETNTNCAADCPASSVQAGRPTNVRGVNPTATTMTIQWTAGAAGSGCTFSSWRVTSTQLDFPPPGCNTLTSRSVTSCAATGIRSGAVIQWLVQEICTNTANNSTVSAPSPPVSTTSTTCRIVNQSCPSNGQNCCAGTTCTSGVCRMNGELPQV